MCQQGFDLTSARLGVAPLKGSGERRHSSRLKPLQPLLRAGALARSRPSFLFRIRAAARSGCLSTMPSYYCGFFTMPFAQAASNSCLVMAPSLLVST